MFPFFSNNVFFELLHSCYGLFWPSGKGGSRSPPVTSELSVLGVPVEYR